MKALQLVIDLLLVLMAVFDIVVTFVLLGVVDQIGFGLVIAALLINACSVALIANRLKLRYSKGK
jgi:hypothetical protein